VALGLTVGLLTAGAARAAEPPYLSTVRPLPAGLAERLEGEFWRPGCPVALSELRLLTVRHRGFDGAVTTGQLVVGREYANALRGVFRVLYDEGFRIRHMRLVDMYGPAAARPARDVSGSFECRRAVPSPCGSGSGNWSNHANGRAIDLNPDENPYVGCGRTREAASRPYLDRSKTRPGMVTPVVVTAFAAIGWEWGGSWTGDTKDYMHFSASGR
jgi:hypothetical protein